MGACKTRCQIIWLNKYGFRHLLYTYVEVTLVTFINIKLYNKPIVALRNQFYSDSQTAYYIENNKNK